MITGKTIFISPIDWGIGHATRCVSIIKNLEKNNNIIIGVTDLNSFFFEKYFPQHQKINLPSYTIKYSNYLPVWLKILMQAFKIKAVIKQETKVLAQIFKDYKFDIIISDNRFGLYNKNCENIFVTHQLNLKTPFFTSLANKINLKYIHRFNKVWVPDYEDENLRLSGQLSNSKNIKIPVEYIGPQSALSFANIIPAAQEKNDYLILLSGVEPQRTILENIFLEKFKTADKNIILVRGTKKKVKIENKNIKIIDFAFDEELKNLILNAETIICRSGYSTLMDLHLLNKKKLILIPTPGQPEQEYLADYWKEKFSAEVLAQQKILASDFET
ncbi:MAG: glycosyltransferase [Bacteroidota bacterium]|nr:glycosyltransferase [Bacteroidota bacterium]